MVNQAIKIFNFKTKAIYTQTYRNINNFLALFLVYCPGVRETLGVI